MIVQVRLEITPLHDLQRNFGTFTRAYLDRLGRAVRDQNIQLAFTPARRGASTPRMMRVESATGARARIVQRTTPSGRRSRDVRGMAGRNYKTAPLPLNKLTTLQAKARSGAQERGGSLWSLLDKGILLDPERYRFTYPDAETLILRVPADRERILTYLRAAGYDYWGMPRDIGGLRPSTYAALLWDDALLAWANAGYVSVPLSAYRGL